MALPWAQLLKGWVELFSGYIQPKPIELSNGQR